MRKHALFILPILLLFSACGEHRDSIDEPYGTITSSYKGNIQSLLVDKCTSCHGSIKAEGNYNMESWSGLFGPGSDGTIRNAIPGNPQSAILTVLSDATHKDILSAEETTLLTDWVVNDRMAYLANADYHPAEWVTPNDRSSTLFHGGFLRSQKWDLNGCRKCHGAQLKGGITEISCTSCHENNAAGCKTCHRTVSNDAALPATTLSGNINPLGGSLGVHAIHVKNNIPCSECHKVPEEMMSEGHLFDDDNRNSNLRAEIVFGPIASKDGYQPSYNPTQKTCRGVYCHALGPKPKVVSWNGVGTVSCGSCHSVPHKSKPYGGYDCSLCHQQSVERCNEGEADCLPTGDGIGVKFIAAHVDGNLGLGRDGAGSCSSCHGTSDSNGAPAPDLQGNTDVSAIGVGVHAAHLTGTGLATNIACSDCHIVPEKTEDASHLDRDMIAEVVFSDFATGKLRGVTLNASWNRETATCSNVYCHDPAGSGQEIKWTEEKSFGCGSCHGFPPGGGHPDDNDCEKCHSAAYKDGDLDPTKHLNGTLEMQ